MLCVCVSVCLSVSECDGMSLLLKNVAGNWETGSLYRTVKLAQYCQTHTHTYFIFFCYPAFTLMPKESRTQTFGWPQSPCTSDTLTLNPKTTSFKYDLTELSHYSIWKLSQKYICISNKNWASSSVKHPSSTSTHKVRSLFDLALMITFLMEAWSRSRRSESCRVGLKKNRMSSYNRTDMMVLPEAAG